MLYSDLLYRFLPLPLLPDRAETLERAWEEAWDAPDASTGLSPRTAGTIRAPFLALAPKDGEPWRPLLIVQGASESGGRRMLTSAVKFTCDEVDADDLLDGIGHDVAASTAILNGARFPWVSPGGTFTHRPCDAKEGDREANGPRSRRRLFRQCGGRNIARNDARHPQSRRRRGKRPGHRLHPDRLRGPRPRQAPALPATGVKAWVLDRIASLVPNDVFAPLLGLYNGMGAHEAHLAREMKLAGQTAIVAPDPLRLAPDRRQPVRRAGPLRGRREARERPNDLLRPADGLDAIGPGQALYREFGRGREARLRREGQCGSDQCGGGEAWRLKPASFCKEGEVPPCAKSSARRSLVNAD